MVGRKSSGSSGWENLISQVTRPAFDQRGQVERERIAESLLATGRVSVWFSPAD